MAAIVIAQAGRTTPGNLPAGPVMLTTELSVICYELMLPTYPKPSRQLGEYGAGGIEA
ncbi:MAG: hypothetical protein NMNS01_13530 [Nitrosomonas sp.]|nr:MAG: hypothetical protein NMNS01_13530 [Nitrosomonas sp.]